MKTSCSVRRFGFILLIVFSLGSVESAEFFKCSRYCKEGWNKFGYSPGNVYKYKYESSITTKINGRKDQESSILFETDVEIAPLSDCDYVMKLSNANYREISVDGNEATTHKDDSMKRADKEFEKRDLYFSFQGGKIDTVCPSDENDEVLNVKKSILSAIQNSAPNFKSNSTVFETDLSGTCSTNYKFENAHEGSVKVEKTKNLDSCSRRILSRNIWTGFDKLNAKSTSLLRSEYVCKQLINKDLILESTNCQERYFFKPFSNGENGIITVASKTLQFISQKDIEVPRQLEKNYRYESLLTAHKNYYNEKVDPDGAINLLKTLERRTKEGIETDIPHLFSTLIKLLQGFDEKTILEVFEKVKNSSKQKTFLFDAMALVTTVDGIKALKKLFENNVISEYQFNSWLNFLLLSNDVSLEMIDAVTELVNLKSIKEKAILCASSLVYNYCSQDQKCNQRNEIQKFIKILQAPLKSGCIPRSPQNQIEILYALKGLGNIGHSDSLQILNRCYNNNDSPLELRLAAIAAHRRVSCAENDNLENLLEYFGQAKEDVEIRIASYLAAMQCASYATISRVKDVLRKEETNQVGSFVWTHLTNLQETSMRWKQTLKYLLENEFLYNKFSTDTRKYSRNYEMSTFFDSLNLGAGFESNVIFTSKSYLPKSLVFNFTLDLFGEMVNIFELGARIEGFEQIVETLFGPEGYFPEETILNVLENMANKTDNQIQHFQNEFASRFTRKKPNGSVYAKIFGNEIFYNYFNETENLGNIKKSNKEIGGFLESLVKILKKQDIEYTKSFVFVDCTYLIPTSVGFPLELSVNGTAITNLNVRGRFDLKDLNAHRLSIEGKIYPSVTVEIIGSMQVHTLGRRVGLLSVNTLNSDAYIDGHVFINREKRIDVRINVPKQNMNIVKVDSQVFLIGSHGSFEVNDASDNVEYWEGCTGKTFSNVTGVQFCHNIRYVDTTNKSNVPFFPLTGSFKYYVGLKKVDVFDNYHFSFKSYSDVKNNRRPIYKMSLNFDTPHSMTNRKIKSFYVIDCVDMVFNSSLISPFVNFDINAKIGDDFDNLGFFLLTRVNDKEVVWLKVSLSSSRDKDVWKYQPLAELSYKGRQMAVVTGLITYQENKKYTAEIKLLGPFEDSLLISGSLEMLRELFNLTAVIESKHLNGHVNAILIKTVETMRLSADAEYFLKGHRKETINVELKHYFVRKGIAFDSSLYVGANFTQIPFYNTLFFIETKCDKLYFENNLSLLILNETWNTQQLFKFLKVNNRISDVAVRMTLKGEQKNIDYAINLSYLNKPDNFELWMLLQISKIKRIEGHVEYLVTDTKRMFDLLLYYPKQSIIINGVFTPLSNNEFDTFIKTDYYNHEKNFSVMKFKGRYVNSTVYQFQNHTVTGNLQIFECGIFFCPTRWNVSSSLQISPDLFINGVQLVADNKDVYKSHSTWSENTISTILQKNEKRLFGFSGTKTKEEFSLLLGINIYQHFELNFYLLSPFKQISLIFYWDKDKNPTKKFSLDASSQTNKGLYVVQIEYPNQKLLASFVVLPVEVTMNITWGFDASQRIYLKAGNKVYDVGGIWFAKLQTPFLYLQNQEFKLSYYIIPQNAELKLDVFWMEKKINLILSGMGSSSRLSGYFTVNTTFPELHTFTLALGHKKNDFENGTKITKSDATFVLNSHQILVQILWNFENSHVSSTLDIMSPSGLISPIIGTLDAYKNKSSHIINNVFTWKDKVLSLDYKCENSQSSIKIQTPFNGLELMNIEYTVIGEENELNLEVKIDVLNRLNYVQLLWNGKDHVDVIKFEVICPIIGEYTIVLKHSTVFGKLFEYFSIKQGVANEIFLLGIQGEFGQNFDVDGRADFKFLENNANFVINRYKNDTKGNTDVEITFNKNYLKSSYEIRRKTDHTIEFLFWNVSSSLLEENIVWRYEHYNNSTYLFSGKLHKKLQLNYTIDVQHWKKIFKVDYVLIHFDTPNYSGMLQYDQFSKRRNFHAIFNEFNGYITNYNLSYVINQHVNFIDDVIFNISTPFKSYFDIYFAILPNNNLTIFTPKFTVKLNDISILESHSLIQHDYPYGYFQTVVNSSYGYSVILEFESDLSSPTKQFHLNMRKSDNVKKSQDVELVDASLSYNLFENIQHKINLKVGILEKKHKVEIDLSTKLEGKERVGKIILISTLPMLEEVFAEITSKFNDNATYIIFGRNKTVVTGKYYEEFSNEKSKIVYSGIITLDSDLDFLKHNPVVSIDYVKKESDMYFKFKSNYAWDPLLIEYNHSFEDQTKIEGLFCWSLLNCGKSQIGGSYIQKKHNMTMKLYWPNQIIDLLAHQNSVKQNRQYLLQARFNDKKFSVDLFRKNEKMKENHTNLEYGAIIVCPYRPIELIYKLEKYENKWTKSLINISWDTKKNSKITYQYYTYPGKLVAKLFLPSLEDDLNLNVNFQSSNLQITVIYSKDIFKKLFFEMNYNEINKSRRFIIRHPVSKIDYVVFLQTVRSPEYTSGNVSLTYVNYLLNRTEEIKSSLTIAHKRFEINGLIETTRNFIKFSTETRLSHDFRNIFVLLQLNENQPLTLDGTHAFKTTGTSLSFITTCGENRKYKFYLGMPSMREITSEVNHVIFDEIDVDQKFTTKLNSSQILWIKFTWKEDWVPKFKKAILEDYYNLKYAVEESGKELIDVIDNDIGQTLLEDVVSMYKNVSTQMKSELESIKNDYDNFLKVVEENTTLSLLSQDMMKLIGKYFSSTSFLETTVKESVFKIISLLRQKILTVEHDVVMFIKGLQNNVILKIQESVTLIENIKTLKLKGKQILKNGIEEARKSLKEINIVVSKASEDLDEYAEEFKNNCQQFFEPYLKIMDDFIIYLEQRLTILHMLVLDVLDEVQHYILNLRESRELLRIYMTYVNWLEEFHVSDILEPIADVVESVLEVLISDAERVFHDYWPYIDALIEALFGRYEEINKIFPVEKIRAVSNKIYYKILWVWNNHKVSDIVKNYFNSLMVDIDNYLASFLTMEYDGDDLETIIGQSDYTFKPDVGVIEITQPLPFEWEAFNEIPYFDHVPLYQKMKKRVESLIQLERIHFVNLLDTIKGYIGDYSYTFLAPPTNNIAIIAGSMHYITFDKKYYSFIGECSYLLATDFYTNSFSVIVNYNSVKKKSLSVISDNSIVSISSDYIVSFNGKDIDLPFVIPEYLVVTRENSKLIVEHQRGLKIVCYLDYDFCNVELSGWLFGKTAGLLGTLDNEKITDMRLPDGNQTNDVLKFVKSWHVGKGKCEDKNYMGEMLRKNISPLTATLFETLCQVFFIHVNSPIGNCFNFVDPKPFYDMCVVNMKETGNPTICLSVAAYKSQCERSQVIIKIPEMCTFCKNGIGLDERIYDQNNPKSVDVVFLKEEHAESEKLTSIPQYLNEELENKNFLGNRFLVVGYGSTIDKPYIHTSKQELWTSYKNTALGTFLKKKTKPNKSVTSLEAIRFALDQEYRPGVVKIFMLIQNNFSVIEDNLGNLHNALKEKDVILHVLYTNESTSNFEFLDPFIKGDNSSFENFNKITDINSLLAISTNGSVLNLYNKTTIQQTKTLQTWGKIISNSAYVSPCQKCKCNINSDGTERIECNRCMSPVIKQLLNEYESNVMEFYDDHDRDDYI